MICSIHLNMLLMKVHSFAMFKTTGGNKIICGYVKKYTSS